MAMELTTTRLVEAMARELKLAVEAITGGTFSTAAAAAPGGQGWGTPVVATGAAEGALTAWLDEAGVRALAALVTGADETPDPAVAVDMLRELWSQAASAAALAEGGPGLSLQVGTPAPGPLPALPGGVAILDGDKTVATMGVAGTIAAKAVSLSPAAGPTTSAPVRTLATTGLSEQLAALLDVDLPLVVRFARTEMPLRALAQLGPGSMLDMGRSPDAPVQLLVGAQVIAEGEVVVVSGNYGVRITALVSAADRLRALES